ncbi:MAG: MGMT family protein [bacterium]|nr:MGMT family protein [bacterium]
MTPLAQKTYTLLKKVPKGRVTTYKALASALGTPAYRAIGQFMKHNPYAPIVPCHRVVASDGTIGGFMGKTSGVQIKKKIALLKKEGISVVQGKIVDFPTRLFSF